MNLWLVTAGLFLLGGVLVALCERSLQTQSVARTLAEVAGVYSAYIIVVGLLVAFNLFQLGRIDSFFTTTRWNVFSVLYWPSWVLTFAPLLIGGTLFVVVVGIRRPRRIMALGLLLVVTFAALETVFLLDVGVLGTVLVQAVLFVLFAGGVYRASRTTRLDESATRSGSAARRDPVGIDGNTKEC
ncbi:MAG: hypothetical protein ACC742_08345 [Thermoanaerobaculales bacterium]